MVWSKWQAALALTVAWAGLAHGQQSLTPPSPGPVPDRYMTVSEAGQSVSRCRILRTWMQSDGSEVHQVQAPAGGEARFRTTHALTEGPAYLRQRALYRQERWRDHET